MMSDYDDIKSDLTAYVEQIISDYELDVDVGQLEETLKRLTNALVYLDEDYNEFDEEDDLIEYRDDIDDFFGE